MRYIMILCLAVLVSGCGISLRSGLVPPVPLSPTLGMTRTEVAALMTRMVTVGYDIDSVTGAAKPVQVKSLYSSELVTVDQATYLIDSYITGVPGVGKAISQDVLTPMIFKNNILAGKGRDAVAALTAQRTHEE